MANRATFTYCRRRSHESALAALEDSYAGGDVSPCEFARIERRMEHHNGEKIAVWHLLLWA